MEFKKRYKIIEKVSSYNLFSEYIGFDKEKKENCYITIYNDLTYQINY